jgi:RNA polymerase sigma factor (sigma-70 family)
MFSLPRHFPSAVGIFLRFPNVWRISGVYEMEKGDCMQDIGQGQEEIVRLVRASQAGDKVAFGRLVQLHQRQAMRAAFGVLGNLDDAAEVVQDAFLKGYLQIGTLVFPGRFRFWMLKIVLNEAVSRQRAARRRVAATKLFRAAGLTKRSVRSDEREHTRDLQKAVERAMVRLTEKEAKALALFGLDGFSHGEVAQVMGCSVEAARWHVYRARQKLRVLLQEYLE